jgi:hypothetical protein
MMSAGMKVYEATLDSIGVSSGVVNEAAIDQGPAIDAMRRVTTALVSVGDRLVFDPELSATWIEHSLFGLLFKGCEDAGSGEFPRHTVARSSSARSNAESAHFSSAPE